MNRSTWVHHYLLDLRTNPLKLSTFSLKSFTLLVLEKLRRPEKGLLTSLWGGREQLVKRPEFWLISRWPEWAFNFLIRISRTVEAIEDSADSEWHVNRTTSISNQFVQISEIFYEDLERLWKSSESSSGSSRENVELLWSSSAVLQRISRLSNRE